MTAYIDLAAKAAHIAVQRDEAIRIAHRLHQTCESLIYGLPKYLEQTAQTDEENTIGKAWHTFDAAAWQLAALPQPASTEPCFECGSIERIGTACAPCNPDLAAAPTSPLPGGGWKPSRNDVARRCDPKAWEFYDRHIDNPIMGAECRAEVAASIRMADAILALPAAPTGESK